MKADRKLLFAVLILIVLVIWLLVLAINKEKETDAIKQTLNELKATKTEVPKAIDGKTPILGVDYFNGTGPSDEQIQKAVNRYIAANPPKNGTNGIGIPGQSTYDIAVLNGFVGTQQQWLDSLKIKGDNGDPAPELQLDCLNGKLVKKYSNASFWEVSNIKCEVENE